MKVVKPIIIVGSGRNGSTVFLEKFSHHPNLAWLSGLCVRFPDRPSTNRFLMRIIDYPIAGRILKKRFHPGECYNFWEFHCKGFRHPIRDLIPEDVTKKTKEKIQNVMSKMLTKNRHRLLIKLTGWPRIGFLHEIFNDAKFIHLVRDGRAVVNSLINVGFWLGWKGPQNWRWGELNSSQTEEWEKYNKSFIALAGIEWKILMDAMEKAKGFINKKDFLEIKYETLCSDPVSTFKEVIDFCDLEWSLGFKNSIKKQTLRNTNYKWKKELTSYQQKVLEEVIGGHLTKYGYI